MYVHVVTYRLAGIDEDEYIDIAHRLAPRFAAMPGLQAKLWLENRDTATYGGLYVWDDEESMDRFVQSDLFEATNPDFDDVTSDGFSVLENLSMSTQPVLEIVQRAATPTKGVIEGRAFPAEEAATRPEARSPKPAAKKAPAKSAPAKKAPAKKAPAKKAPAAKAPPKKAPATKAPAAKATSKKAPAKTAGARKAPATKAPAKTAGAKKTPAKKAL